MSEIFHHDLRVTVNYNFHFVSCILLWNSDVTISSLYLANSAEHPWIPRSITKSFKLIFASTEWRSFWWQIKIALLWYFVSQWMKSCPLYFTAVHLFDWVSLEKLWITPQKPPSFYRNSIKCNSLLLPLMWGLSLTANIQAYKPYLLIFLPILPENFFLMMLILTFWTYLSSQHRYNILFQMSFHHIIWFCWKCL